MGVSNCIICLFLLSLAANISGIDFLKGKTVDLVRVEKTLTIHWKQGSFLGFGGDRSQTYRLCTYKFSDGGTIPVYIQSDWTIPNRLKLDGRMQYGLNDGIVFIVFHNKEQTPYQHRYIMNDKQKLLYGGNQALKFFKGIDLSWVAGDYLHNL